MGSIFGKAFQIATFGESHGGAVGVVIDGCPPGQPWGEDGKILGSEQRVLKRDHGGFNDYY